MGRGSGDDRRPLGESGGTLGRQPLSGQERDDRRTLLLVLAAKELLSIRGYEPHSTCSPPPASTGRRLAQGRLCLVCATRMARRELGDHLLPVIDEALIELYESLVEVPYPGSSLTDDFRALERLGQVPRAEAADLLARTVMRLLDFSGRR